MMNKYLSYISLFLLILSLSGCIEEQDIPYLTAGQVEVKLYLNMPGDEDETVTRAGGIDTEVGGLDETTQEQRYVRDVTVLLIQNGRVIQVADDLKIEGVQGAAMRNLTLTADATREAVDAMVVINALENGISASAITSLLGKTLAEVRNTLIYSYPDDPSGNPLVWNLSSRYLPMWGMTKNLDLSRSDTYGSCDIYRSVAKMSLMVDESCTGFQMEEVYVYYMERKGYLMSGHTPDAAMSKQYMLPDVPETSVQTTRKNSVMYDVSDNGIANRIFVPESDNKTPASSKKQLKIVVGGTWSGEGIEGAGKKNYWRIDMCDELDNPYDIIRNHSYIYNITKVSNPGTPTPDEALESAVATLGVEVEDWTPRFMRGVPDQYVLTTSKSVITLNGYTDISEHSFDVWTDYEGGWTIETDANGKIIDSSSGEAKPIEWLTINKVNGPCNHTVTVKVNAEKINLGATLTNRFWIKAGNIRKEITVIFPQPPTANSYVVGDSAKDGDYSINVCIKGNGIDGTRPEGVDIVPGEEGLSLEEEVSLHPHELGIIWETKAGLISLKNPQTGKYVTGSVRVPFNPETNSLDFKTDLNGAEIGSKEGGNALIGAFDDNGVVIWSWHIWVCPEMYNPDTGQIIEEQFLEDWTISGYEFMDRNLGALSNVPSYDNQSSVASMGLQYQWGRKDPFVGPAYSNDNFTGTGLLPVVHYYKEWGVNGSTTSTAQMPEEYRNIDYTVANPTQLVYWVHPDGKPTALVSLDDIGPYLWGTNKGFVSEDVKELGTKTIYDPCPVGYRVPPVDAYVFHSVYPDFPHPNKDNYTKVTRIKYTDKTVSYYENDYFTFYFVPDYTTTIDNIESAQAGPSTGTRFGRFLKLGKYTKDASGNEVFKPLEYYKRSELSSVYGFEHVFIQWYDSNKKAYTAPIYYKKLTNDNFVDPGSAAVYFRLVKPTDVSNTVSVENLNFNYNLLNIPFNPVKSDKFTRNVDFTNKAYWYLGKYAGNYTEGAYNPEHPKATVMSNAYYYGFYLNYADMDEPKTKDCRHEYILDEVNPSTITWLPLTGAYDPTKGITFKIDGNRSIPVESGSSISVNSFLWTNSAITKSSTVYPGGIALHCAESRGNYDTYFGRHIHGLRKADVQVERHYTAALRCVKDVKKVVWDDVNSLTKSVSISSGGTAEITLRSVNGSWKLVDPGAPWLIVTPDKGEPNRGDANNNVTLKVKSGTAVGKTTNISFLIEGETSFRNCKVKVIAP